MAPMVDISGSNSGLQVGVNHGSITAEFHLSPNLDDKLLIAHGAAFGSYGDQHEDECLDGTRTDILRQIREWASSFHGPSIFWLNGMAGTGKSTISRTIAKSFRDDKSNNALGASFFFKRGEGDRGHAGKLFPTIARQLAKSVPKVKPALEKAIRDDPDIAAKAMREQFESLILKPLQSLRRHDLPVQTMAIIIDALDECEGEKDIRLIIQLLSRLKEVNAIYLRVFLTSRPELPIWLGLSELANNDHKDMVLHKIPEEVIKHDISLFLESRISKIRGERQPPLHHDWPGDTNFQKLVALSTPLFIFAATICRILQDPYWDPDESLTEVLAHEHDESKLDGTYLPVLKRLLDRQQSEKKRNRLIQEFEQVIGAIMVLESPLSVTSLSKLLYVSKGLIHTRLNALRSVLSVPDDETLPIRLFHLSFRDFLLDPETRMKTPFGIDEKETHTKLTRQCLLICQKGLRKNICALPSDGTQRAEVNRQAINDHLPPELQYACRYWVYHLIQCKGLIGMMHDAFSFLRTHFLHWVEAMSLLGLTSEILDILNRFQTAIFGNDSSSISGLLQDAKRFILKNYQIVDQAPLQVYCAGLIFAPRTAIVRELFREKLPTWICQLPRVEERWGALTQTLEGHSDYINSVAFSPDSRLLASGSDDDTVRLWDPVTGALTQTLEGHLGYVNSVAFSPDSRLLASGSDDRTVRLWDPVTGALTQTRNVQMEVTQLNFSYDGLYLHTNLGTFDISSLCNITTSYSPHTNLCISFDDEHWIKLNGEKALWLPVEYRPTCFQINGNTVALGHASGRVSFIGFCI